MPKLPLKFAPLTAIGWLCCGCLTAGGYETARATPPGEIKSTTAGGITMYSGPYHRYELTNYDGETRPNHERDHLPAAPFEGEYLFRWSRGVAHGLEFDLALQTPILHPFGFGAGMGAGVKQQFFGGRDGPLALAAAVRLMGHLHAVGNGGGSSSFATGQIHGRLIASYHGEQALGVVAPTFVAEGVTQGLEPPDSDNYSGSSSGTLWGVSLGPGWEFEDQLWLVELTVLVGDDSGFPWSADNRFALLPRSTNHFRISLGIASAEFGSADD